MKAFSKSWKSSKNKRKKKKYVANAPLHIKHKFLSANLSKELRKKHGRRSFPLRKGDEVKVMRGEFKGKKGKIESIELENSRVGIEKIQKKKKDGTKVAVSFRPSNLQVQSLNLEDKEREKRLKKIEGEEGKEGKKEGKEKKSKKGKGKGKKSKGEKKSKKKSKKGKNKGKKSGEKK